jgi:site-specific DNA-cytosine methylase
MPNKSKGLVVLSLFNGMSTGHTALDNLGIKIDKYYSSEIKPAAIKLTQHHYPNTIQVGDVTKWKEWDIDWKSVDMVLSGSPCQDLSAAGKRKGLTGERSSLFFVFVDILNHIKKLNPNVLFLQENVGSANTKDVGTMSRALGVYPVRINSSLVTAQLRDRYYWSNIRTAKDGLFGDIVTDIPQPKDKKIILKDILTSGVVDSEKHRCLTTKKGASSQKAIRHRNATTGRLTVIKEGDDVRLCNRLEMSRLQGFPDDWCDILTEVQTHDVLGDGWTLPIIEHIFSFIGVNNAEQK